MVYGDLQFFDIIIFAVVAAFIIYRLKNVLGKRTGFQKNIVQEELAENNPQQDQKKVPVLKENEKKLEVVYREISSFDHKQFLDGAKKAFEVIIASFNKGDKKTLKSLVSKDVFNTFEKAIDSGKNNSKSEFYSLVVEGIEDAKVNNGLISISVNFISEQIIGDNEEEIIKNKDTWVFEKAVDPNNFAWILIAT